MALRVALDTNAWSAFARGDADVVVTLETAESIYLPFVVIGELRAGFALGTKGRSNEAVLARFVARPDVRVLQSSDATTRH